MCRYLSLLLFIGLAWGQVESDTSQIDYYELGAIAAKQDFNQYYSFFACCPIILNMLWLFSEKGDTPRALSNPIFTPAAMITPAIFLFLPVKPKQKHNPILNTGNGKTFETGYKEEAMNIKVKSVLAGIASNQIANFIKNAFLNSLQTG